MKSSLFRSIAAGAVAAAALGMAVPALAQDEVVNLYTSRHYDADEQLYQRFTEQTGIEVNVIEGNADELIERMRNEGANSPADVLITVDAGRLWRAKEAGVLQSIESETLNERVPENLRDPDGQWYGLTKRARVLIYNRDAVDPTELSSYEDLAEDEWNDRVLIRSSSNVYNQSLAGSMIAALGEDRTSEWAAGMVENMARPPQGGDTDQIRAVAAGEGDVAVSNTYYLGRLINSDDPADQEVASKVAVFFPNQEGRGTHVNISGAGVAAFAPNPDNARAFLEFMVSDEAQEIFAGANEELMRAALEQNVVPVSPATDTA